MLCSHPTDTVFSDFFCLVFSSFNIPFPCPATLLILFPVLPSSFHTLPFSLSLQFSARLHYLQPSGSVGKESGAMQETWVWSPCQEDPLEKRMATHSSTLAWIVHGQTNWAGYSPWDHKESDMTVLLSLKDLLASRGADLIPHTCSELLLPLADRIK